MPGVYFGPYGSQFGSHAEPANGNCGRFPLGHRLVLPDGREYRYALLGAVVGVAGNLYQSVAPIAHHTNIACDVSRAIGAVAISATMGATLAAVDIYSEGMVHTNAPPGEGYGYRIRRAIAEGQAHAAAAASGILTVNLEPGEALQVALTLTTSDVSFTRNRFHSAIIHLSPPTADLVGVAPIPVTASYYHYSQVKGYAAVLADGTLLVGLPVQASITTNGSVENKKTRIRTSATAAGDVTAFVLLTDQDGTNTTAAVGTIAASTTADISGGVAYNAPVVGMCVKVNASTEYALVSLDIE